jgi:hypothetical protein
MVTFLRIVLLLAKKVDGGEQRVDMTPIYTFPAFDRRVEDLHRLTSTLTTLHHSKDTMPVGLHHQAECIEYRCETVGHASGEDAIIQSVQ